MNATSPSSSERKTRGRPERLSLADVIKALGADHRSPSVIASSLGVSRATLHRKITTLQKQGLVLSFGNGRSRAYRLPSPLEQIESLRADIAAREVGKNEFRCRLVLGTKAARRFVYDIDLAIRVGIGQFERVAESIRERCFSENPISSDTALEQLASTCGSLKVHLLGLSITASHGIYSPHVDMSFLLMRSVLGAVRHRLAWDHNPNGTFGVHHDEPIANLDLNESIVVYSTDDSSCGESQIVIEASAKILLEIAAGLALARRLQDGDFDAFIELAREAKLKRLEGAPVTPSIIASAESLIKSMKAVWSKEVACWTSSRLAIESCRSHEQKCLEQLIVTIASRSEASPAEHVLAGSRAMASVLRGDEPMFGVALKPLPDGYFVARTASDYRVIGPDKSPAKLRIYSKSSSLQTAILMAHNAINGSCSRGLGF